MAVANDCQFIEAPALQQLFRDKDTGLPLSSGAVEFYVDTARTTLKPVFQNTGTPANPIYIELPNPVILNIAGAFNQAIYYHPYDDQGNVELYFIVVKNAQGVLQFTRESYPSVCTDGDGDEGIPAPNYWGNSQFRMRIDVPEGGATTGEIISAVTPVGYEGYQIALPENFTSTNIVTFQTFTQTIEIPEAHPPAAIIIECTNPVASEGFKDLRKEFIDVNFLAGEEVTLQFESLTDGGDVNVDIIIISNFGSGGSATEEEQVATFTVSSGDFTKQAFTFTMPDNDGATISSDVFESSVFFALRFPSSVLFQARFTNFLLQKGAFEVVNFPDYSLSQSISQALAGSLPPPNPDGSDKGKIIRLSETPRAASNDNYPSLIYSTEQPANLIYGGNFSTNPWQRSIDDDDNDPFIFKIDPTVDKIYTADRFQLASPAGNVDREFEGQVQRIADSPTVSQSGMFLSHSLQIITSVTPQSTTLSDPYYLDYGIEGYDFQSIAQQPFNLNFWTKQTVEGVYSVSLSNSAQDSVIVLEFTILNSNVWQFVSLPVPASIAAGGWSYDSGHGLRIRFNLTPVTTPATIVGSWVNPASSTDFVSPNQVNALSSLGNLSIYNLINISIGSSASPFIEDKFPVLMDKLQRYFERSARPLQIANIQSSEGQTKTIRFSQSSTQLSAVQFFQTKKRAVPFTQGNTKGLPIENKSNFYRIDTGDIGSIQLTGGFQANVQVLLNLSTLNNATDGFDAVGEHQIFGWWASAEF